MELAADGGSLGLRASGRTLRDPGFLRAYEDPQVRGSVAADGASGHAVDH